MKKVLFSALFMSAFAAQAQTIPNGGMEDWRDCSKHDLAMAVPTYWQSEDSTMQSVMERYYDDSTFQPMLFKESTRVHSGSAAVKIITEKLGAMGTQSGVLSNGYVGPVTVGGVPSGTYTDGGFNISSRITTVSAWLSFSPSVITDAGAFTVYAVKTGAGFAGYDSVLGTGQVLVYGERPYAQYDCKINYTDPGMVPDRLIMAFFVDGDKSNAAGSAFYVDDVTMVDPMGIEMPVFTGETFKVFPNPAKEVLHITHTAGAMLLKIYNLTGQLMQQQTIDGNASVDIRSLPAGSYMYQANIPGTNARPYSGTFIKR